MKSGKEDIDKLMINFDSKKKKTHRHENPATTKKF